MRKTWLFVALIAAISKTLPATNAPIVRDYIEQYSHIAVYESVRSSIPASIILGQAILESQFGTGKLAKTANNHFGIKWTCAKDGSYVMMQDDDYDAKGNLIHSRFIKYNSAEESYVHHTDFLMTRGNYKRLFAFDRTDYRRWAKGLSDCHYATDPLYAKKLVEIIEKNNLQQYDTPSVLALDEDDFKANDAITATNNPLKKENIETTQSVSNEFKASNEEDTLFEISATKAAPAKLKTQTINSKQSTSNQLFEVITDDDTPRGTGKKPKATSKTPKR